MATSTSAAFLLQVQNPLLAAPRVRAARRRRVSRESGRALEILGHAIEYLTDEFVHQGGAFATRSEQLAAVQMLMAANRQVYYECPEIPTLADRFRALVARYAH